jgi:putative DNA primase/helicase
MSFHERTTHAAKGKWRGILLELGVPETFLRDKHGPCPLCGGQDRFRWDNRDGSGSYICGQCGAGDGMKLAVEFTGKPFQEVASQIDGFVGNIKATAPRPGLSDDDRRQALRAVYAATQPVAPGDLAHRYLEARKVDELIYPKALRFGAALKDGQGGLRPCMVAMVSDPDGKPVSMHRTFLRPDGLAKAEMEAPRRLMPGDLPDGSCVRLCEWTGGPLGIAEGIETALSASAMFDLPVWSAINSALLAKWCPPDGCEEIAVFADNDPKFGGQAAAYRLAHRLAVKGLHVTVHVPPLPGEDWNDIHMRGKA